MLKLFWYIPFYIPYMYPFIYDYYENKEYKSWNYEFWHIPFILPTILEAGYLAAAASATAYKYRLVLFIVNVVRISVYEW